MIKNLPEWKPLSSTLFKIQSMDKKIAFKSFRCSSSGYIAKPSVRDYIFQNTGRFCKICKSTDNLQIDHIKSVWYCFKNSLLEYCNTQGNLQVLCRKCNTSKKP